MLEELRACCKRQNISSDDSIAIAVSGGVDSMALLYSCSQYFKNIVVLHVNYHLRGEDSDMDESLVRSYCESLKIPFKCKSINIESQNKSIQEEARNKRYAWFTEEANRLELEYMFIAHHLDDQLETFLMNLERGSGLNGLSGMSERNGLYIRPFLSLQKEEIKMFAAKNEIPFREDESNTSNKYLRNALRNKVIPSLKVELPNLMKGLQKSLGLIEVSNQLIEKRVNDFRESILETKSLPFDSLNYENEVVLSALLKEWGLHLSEYEKLKLSVANKQIGSVYQLNQGEVLVDRLSLKFRFKTSDIDALEIVSEDCVVDLPHAELEFRKVERSAVDFASGAEYINGDHLKFPLQLRKWKTGDRFQPLGMKGMKKVSDFLIDMKVDRFEKDNVWVLTSEEKIVNVLSYRLDERFKIEKDSNCVYLVHVKTKNND